MKVVIFAFILLAGCASAPAIVAPALSQLDAVMRDPSVRSLPETSRATLTGAIIQAKAEVVEAKKEQRTAGIWKWIGSLSGSFVAGIIFGYIIKRF